MNMFLFLNLCIYSYVQFADALEIQIDPSIYKNKYGSYFVPLNHLRPAVEKIKKGEVYEEDTLKYIEKIYEKGTSIVHAGTYYGDMLPFFSSLAEGNSVWAFEPVELNYTCAKKNVLLNKLENINLFHCALSDSTTQLFMKTKQNDQFLGGASSITEKTSENAKDTFEKIEAVKLDDILSENSQRISIIHLDVEGHELFALNGGRQTIKKHRPVIILEVWGNSSEKIYNYMYSIGYRVIRKIDGNVVFFPNEKPVNYPALKDGACKGN